MVRVRSFTEGLIRQIEQLERGILVLRQQHLVVAPFSNSYMGTITEDFECSSCLCLTIEEDIQAV